MPGIIKAFDMVSPVHPVTINARIEEDIWNLPEVPIGMEE
jgi:hypothetical protein